MGFILLLAVIGITAWAVSWQPRADRAVAEPAEEEARSPTETVGPDRVESSVASAQESSGQWTALDEYQLNRLLNETT